MEIRIDKEAYREIVEIQVEEYEEGAHLCEQKLAVLFEHGIEADGALGFLLDRFDATSGSDRGHTTAVGGFDEDSFDGEVVTFDGLVVNCFDETDEMIHDEYRITVEGGDHFRATVAYDDPSSPERAEVTEV